MREQGSTVELSGVLSTFCPADGGVSSTAPSAIQRRTFKISAP